MANEKNLVPQNNTSKTYGPCRMEEYYSNTNTIPPHFEHLYTCNARVQIARLDNEARIRRGEMPVFNPQAHRIMERYRNQFLRFGRATYHKSQDDIIGG